MAGLKDFLFGSGSLKKAAGDIPKAPAAESAGLDMAKLAQESADRQKSSATAPPSTKSGSPLSTTMTPMKKGK